MKLGAEACAAAYIHWGRSILFSPSGGDPEAAAGRDYTLSLRPDAPAVDDRGARAWWAYPGGSLRVSVEGGAAAGDVVRPAAIPWAWQDLSHT